MLFNDFYNTIQISEYVIHIDFRPWWITPSSICLILNILLNLIH